MASVSQKIMGIYKITNLINGMCYIGQSANICRRWQSHKCNSRGSHNKYLKRAINKYGIDNFGFEILEKCKIENLDNLEKRYIALYNCVAPSGYNMDFGGYRDREIGSETRKRLRLQATGKNNPNYGKPKSKAFKKMIAAANSKPVSQYTSDGEYIATYSNARSIPDYPNGYKNISLCCNGKTKLAYGYQ